jgi:hypothetical protein
VIQGTADLTARNSVRRSTDAYSTFEEVAHG